MELYLIFGISVLGLLFALYLMRDVLRRDVGTERMREISDAIKLGAEAFLRRQNRTIAVLAIALAALIYILYAFVRTPTVHDPAGPAALAFWTTRVYSIHEFYYALILLFSGQFVPLTLMPKLVQNIAQYLPFQLFIYFPIQVILGKLSPAQITQGYVMAGVWLVLALAFFNWVWRNGVKRYSAVGA